MTNDELNTALDALVLTSEERAIAILLKNYFNEEISDLQDKIYRLEHKLSRRIDNCRNGV
jgi:hypothetical protein